MMYAQNIVIIIMNFRFLRAGHKAGIACERHTREMEKAPLSTQCAGIKSSRPNAHMFHGCNLIDRGGAARSAYRKPALKGSHVAICTSADRSST